MNKKFQTIIIFLSLFLIPQLAFAQSKSQNVEISIISSMESVPAGSNFNIALKQKIAPNWHTYWRNPGDVGDATRIEWEAPNGIEIGNIQWPAPKRLPYADFINYGYDNEVVFPINVKIGANLNGPQTIKGKVSWLECKDVCVPGEGEIILNFTIGDARESANKSIIESAIAKLPNTLKDYTANWVKDADGRFHLGIVTSNDLGIKNAYFYPYEVDGGALIDHAKPQELTFGIGGFGLYLTPSPSMPEKMPNPIAGVIEIEGKNGVQYFEISSTPSNAKSPKTFGAKGSGGLEIGKLLGAVGFAILGGIILNLMPCVFPVLAMKILGLTKIAHGDNIIARNYGWFYFLGVMATFALLGILLFAFKSIGAAIGWGFQLQDPRFLTIMVIVLIALGLNLLGLFEIGTNFQNIGGNLSQKSGNLGAFFSGVLAVSVASPCTAPFMGAALGYAITQSPYLGLFVFLGLGFGFALPFVLLTLSPKLLAKLPKPGPWMDKLKKILSIPMFLTAIWLLWVLSSVTAFSNILSIFVMAGLMILVFYFLSKYQKSLPRFSYIFAIIFFLIGALIIAAPQPHKESANGAKVAANEWSDERVQKELDAGNKVFVNFTADWCITCKVNEKAVFQNSKVIQSMAQNKTVYLVADWTNKDEKIARALSSHGRVGVPLYLMYHDKAREPIVLPQLLTPNIVVEALER